MSRLHAADLQRIADYVMPVYPARRSDLGFLFGTRHGVAEFCESASTNTGENVRFGRARVVEAMGDAAFQSVIAIGKVCSIRRYLMTLQRHWPGLSMSAHPVNYFGVPAERWFEHDEFRERVLSEFEKMPRYLAAGFLEELA